MNDNFLKKGPPNELTREELEKAIIFAIDFILDLDFIDEVEAYDKISWICEQIGILRFDYDTMIQRYWYRINNEKEKK